MGNALVGFFIFQPPKHSKKDKGRHSQVLSKKYCNELWVTNEYGNDIRCFYIERSRSNVTLLYSHANAEDIPSISYWLYYLSKELKVSIMSYDYSGYGESDGEPSEKNCYADIDAVYHHLVYDMNRQPENIILLGRSLGSGPTCYLASRTSQEERPVGGIILHSAFTSIYRIVADIGCSMNGDVFPNIDYLNFFDTETPVLIVHGTSDNIVPFQHGRNLVTALPHVTTVETFFVEGLGHNSMDEYQVLLFVNQLQQFIERHLPAATRKIGLSKSSSYIKKTRTSDV